ncbi:Uroporphyrinogen decarboxylase [Rickettsiales bacterium Ac37b]|nr:Uroporphyrinogen decarboxylase [Rickettsiales bacterium Ac37b]
MSQLIENNSLTKKQIPIWLMRQAGRYLPEYMEIRKGTKNFLELCYTPKLACEVTLQPIKRFGLDAAIIFSDILTIVDALGIKVTFEENIGPIIAEIFPEDLDKIRKNINNITKKLEPVYEAVSLTRSKLDKSVPLIGFAGAPWTLASYIIEGRGTRDFNKAKTTAYHNKKFFLEIIDILKEAIIIHLNNQINAGADLIQIFDSWAGVLPEGEFQELVIKPTSDIVKSVILENNNIPIIGFPKGASFYYEEYVKQTKVDIISLDSNVSSTFAQNNLMNNCVIQGNLDPIYLLGKKDVIAKEAEKVLSNFAGGKLIFNLGHGVLPNTPIENVQFLVELVKKWKN